VRVLIERKQADLARHYALLAAKDLQYHRAMHELAHYRRVRFGKASEALF